MIVQGHDHKATTPSIRGRSPRAERVHSEVKLYKGEIKVSHRRHSAPGPGQCSVRPIAATPCGSDMNVVTGSKNIASPVSVRIGHEMVGVITAVGSPDERLAAGDYVVLRPHQYLPGHDLCPRSDDPRTYRCQGRGCTTHAGFHWDGALCAEGLFPVTQLQLVPRQLREVSGRGLPAASLLSLVEPIACCRTAAAAIEDAYHMELTKRDPFGDSALVIGAGPIGVIIARELLDRGCNEVVLHDQTPHRARLGEWALDDPGRVRRYNTEQDRGHRFRLVVVTANRSEAICAAERHVEAHGVLYVMSGLEPTSRQMSDPGDIWNYERLHRYGEWALSEGDYTGPRAVGGHSGYSEHIFNDSLRWVGRQQYMLDRLMTHVISGLDSPTIASRFPDVVPGWVTPDGSPAVLHLLRREIPRHALGLKAVVLPGGGTEAA